MSGKLYVVGTPLGNLSDFSPRAKETLAQVDFICAEDTRVTSKLLSAFDIKQKTVSYHEHNEAQSRAEIINRLEAGQTAALCTDAGMPAISDPGRELVYECRQRGIAVETVPGPTALTTALAASGMNCSRFCFEGFMSTSKKERLIHLCELKSEKRTMVFYEAPHRLLDTLKEMLTTFGNREIAIARELTKLHEEIINTTLEDAVKAYQENAPKGEFVLIVGGAKCEKEQMTLEDAVALAKNYVNQGSSPTYAAKAAALESGFKKGDIYNHLINK